MLKEFVPLFQELELLGCPSPVLVTCLHAFSQVDPAVLAPPSLDGFAGGDVGSRVRFFTSTLYKDFTHLRSAGLLEAARNAMDRAERLAAIAALRSAAANAEVDEENLHKFGDWAHSLFAVGDPALALKFAFGDDAPARVRFAMSFRRLEGDVYWEGALVLVDSDAEVASTLSAEAFFKVVDTSVSAGLRKAIANPLALAIVDFHQELLQGASDQSPWQHDLLVAAAAVKLGISGWRSDFDGDRLPNEKLTLVARCLQKLWAFKGPAWSATVREKAAAMRAAEKEKAVAVCGAAAEETPAPGSVQPEGGAPALENATPGTPNGGIAPDAGALALGDAVGTARDTAPAIPKAATAKAKAAAKPKGKGAANKAADQPAAPFAKGDLVRLVGSVKKGYKGLEGKVENVGPSEVRLCITTPGPFKGKEKRVQHAAAKLVKSAKAEAAAVPVSVDDLMVAQLLPPGSATTTLTRSASSSSATREAMDAEEAALASMLFVE